MKPLVSILIPAYNAEKWIAESLQSAIAQTWQRKEIIVVNDGSTDRTAEVARRFTPKGVAVVSTANHGVAAACNEAFRVCQGDYIQWLAADDLLAPDKIERQVAAVREGESRRILLSSPWAHFYHRTRRAHFVPTSLWQDLSPVEWLLRKMNENLHMQPATWLTSRELIEAAGPEDTRLVFDDDGEYYCRVLLASEGTRFVPDAKVFYRVTTSSRVSYIGTSDKKKDALLLSMRLHIQYLRSLEESERVRKACLTYVQNWYPVFYPERPDLVAELKGMAAQLQGHLEEPRLRWKYAWMKPIFGWKVAKQAQMGLPQWKASLLRRWDKAMYMLEARPPTGTHVSQTTRVNRGDKTELGWECSAKKPLVSILIPAYNAEKWIAYTLQSAITQTWQRKEIIVVDDGSTDRTAEVARRFASRGVTVVSTRNQGASAARNHALKLSKGDYIQWLDADDLLAPDKIERQLAALREDDSKRILLSSPWAPFYFRTRHARVVHNSLWQDLSPVEWLLRSMGENLFTQTATWLTSRELVEAAGPWDTRLLVDDDGEYYARALLASEGTRFVPEARVFYRVTPPNRLSHIGSSDKKKDAMLLSMKLHINYLRSLEESERVRKACLAYLETWQIVFYPERADIVAELQSLAAQLQGRLEVPRVRRKYAWMKPVLGWRAAKWAQGSLPHMRLAVIRQWDKAMYKLEGGEEAARRATHTTNAIQGD